MANVPEKQLRHVRPEENLRLCKTYGLEPQSSHFYTNWKGETYVAVSTSTFGEGRPYRTVNIKKLMGDRLIDVASGRVGYYEHEIAIHKLQIDGFESEYLGETKPPKGKRGFGLFRVFLEEAIRLKKAHNLKCKITIFSANRQLMKYYENYAIHFPKGELEGTFRGNSFVPEKHARNATRRRLRK